MNILRLVEDILHLVIKAWALLWWLMLSLFCFLVASCLAPLWKRFVIVLVDFVTLWGNGFVLLVSFLSLGPTWAILAKQRACQIHPGGVRHVPRYASWPPRWLQIGRSMLGLLTITFTCFFWHHFWIDFDRILAPFWLHFGSMFNDLLSSWADFLHKCSKCNN